MSPKKSKKFLIGFELLSLIAILGGLFVSPTCAAPATSTRSGAGLSLPGLFGKNLDDYEAVLGPPRFVAPVTSDGATKQPQARYYKATIPSVERVILTCGGSRDADGMEVLDPPVTKVECQFAPNGSVKTWQAALTALGISPAGAVATGSDSGVTTLKLAMTPAAFRVAWILHGPVKGSNGSPQNAVSSLEFIIVGATPPSESPQGSATTGGETVRYTVGAEQIRPPAIDLQNLPDQQAVRQMADQWRNQYHLPGIWCAVIRGGKVVACVATGVKNIKTGAPATINDFLPVGSVSKVISGMLISQLVAKGTISYDTTVGQMFPEYAGKYPNSPLLRATLRQLMSHTAGLPAGQQSSKASPNSTGLEWRAGEVENDVKDPRLVEPGTRQVYSGIGIDLAVAMVERSLKGQYSFEQWIHGSEGKALGLYEPHSLDGMVVPHSGDVFPHLFNQDGSLTCMTQAQHYVNHHATATRFSPMGSFSLTLTDFSAFGIDTLTNACHLSPAICYEVYSKSASNGVSRNSSAGWQVSSDGTLYHDGNTGRGECAGIELIPNRNTGFVVYINASYPEGVQPPANNFFVGIQKDLNDLIRS